LRLGSIVVMAMLVTQMIPLYKFVTEYTANDGAIFAAATLAAIPTTIVLFACQRWIWGGLRAGALEG
jgi:ABC-type maltose transport system permease subunit